MGIRKALLSVTTIFFLLSLLSSTTTNTSAGPDSIAMAELAAALNATHSVWPTNASSAYCHWEGVRCDSSGRVTRIILYSKTLSGSLPPELSSLSGLQTLDLSNNSLSGPLPYLANLTRLCSLYLHNNNFTSIPPGFFQGLSSLQNLELSNNSYLAPWSFPTELTKSRNLSKLEASNANIVGSLPDNFDYFPYLFRVDLSYNNLTGSLPASLGNIDIQYLWLENQQIGLSGTIDVLSRMTSLSQVRLNGNKFTGPIPSLYKITYLSDLLLHDNLLTGTVTDDVTQLSKLSHISLKNNMLQGPSPIFPPDVKVDLNGTNNFCTNTGYPCDPQVTTLLQIAADLGYPLTLSESWKGNNACEHWRFITCNSEERVSVVNLTKQHFTGMISPAIVNLTALEGLYLNDNNLTGYIPDNLTKLSQLRVLDVSNNNLSGKVPVFASSVKLNTTGNPLLSDGSPADGIKDKGRDTIIIIIAVIIGTITIGICTFFSWRWMAKHRGSRSAWKLKSEVMLSFDLGEAYSNFLGHDLVEGKRHQIKLKDLPLLKFEKVASATNNFHLDNKLGQGGFGPVYRGKLQNGQEIAVKRLSTASGQGLEEFMNEVLVISKLQHRNLVRLLGCCVDREEKMLVYEYMPNKSLDAFLFDPLKQEILDWRKRINIIEGIARGLLYLHRDSRLKIIHRDLKPSNILLDEELNPKISDFGVARIFGGTEDQANTKRVVGTYGYMSPEYAMEGRFSEKSDVFSFGVLLLEILSGRRNTSFYNNEQALSLLGYAWKLWNEDNIVAIIDPLMSNPCFEMEILRCIQVGLLCVQEFPMDRPYVSKVISMLDSEVRNLPTPKQPGFTDTQFALVTDCSQQRFSINNVTITTLEGR